MDLLNQAKQFVSDKFGPGETVTMDRGKLARSLAEFVRSLETNEEENPELEKMRDKFNDWLDGRISRLKAPTNWVDITAEFVLEQIRDRESWDEVIEE